MLYSLSVFVILVDSEYLMFLAKWQTLLHIFKVSMKRIYIVDNLLVKFSMTN